MKQQFMQRTRKVLSPGQVSRIPFFEKQFRQDLKREFIQRQRGKPGENNPGANPGRPENPGNPGGPGGRP
jgi:hypothetical protein